MSRMDDYNYYMDPRTIAGSIDKPKILERQGRSYILWTTENDEGIEEEHELLCKWEVCDLCRGEGRCVNPSIDASGITQDEWDEWEPDDREMYMNGGYDITCPECKGRRVTPVLDENNNDAALVKRYQDYLTDLYNHARESAQERAMGA